MQQHSNWIEETKIKHTPTFFINGKGLPGRYNLETIEKLIPSLTEEQDMFIMSIPNELRTAELG